MENKTSDLLDEFESKAAPFRVKFTLGGLIASALIVITASGYAGYEISKYFGVGKNQRAQIQSLENRVDVLSKAIERVDSTERELKSRSTFLDALLDDAVQLDRQHFAVQAMPDPLLPITERLGIGGPDRNYFYGKKSLLSSIAVNSSELQKVAPEEDEYKGIDLQLTKLQAIPVGSPVEGRISSGFGDRSHPVLGFRKGHNGIDIAVDYKTSVVATAEGKVLHAGRKGSYGNVIVIDHGNGIQTVYAHLSRVDVAKGSTVCRGQQIGQIGSTGRSTGPHLHYEVVQKGRQIDPSSFMRLSNMLRIIG